MTNKFDKVNGIMGRGEERLREWSRRDGSEKGGEEEEEDSEEEASVSRAESGGKSVVPKIRQRLDYRLSLIPQSILLQFLKGKKRLN